MAPGRGEYGWLLLLVDHQSQRQLVNELVGGGIRRGSGWTGNWMEGEAAGGARLARD